VYKVLNLFIAWEKVKANRGSGGVDRVTVEEFDRRRGENLEEIHRLLREDRYEPTPVRRVWIPKGDGKKRPLGIPTIRDRVVQQALLNKMEKIFEAKFLESSYGFRPKRSCHGAIKKVEGYLKEGSQWVVEVDIEKFFDTVDHELMLDKVNEEISDGRVLRLIRKFLKAGVMEEMKVERPTEGTPQGGVISPLLANIYLHTFDEQMSAGGYKVVRYADDIVVLCRSEEEAKRVMAKIKEILEGELRLKLNPEKTRIVHLSKGFEFLGYVFRWGYKYPRNKSREAFEDKIRHMTRRSQPKSVSQIIKEINPVIRGWGNYFMYGSCLMLYRKYDYWIRRRLRAFKAKKWVSIRTWREYPESRWKELG